MTPAQKRVTKILWVIKGSVRPNYSDMQARDIIRQMVGDNDEAFKKHVLVVFTFCDKAPMDMGYEWLQQLCDPPNEEGDRAGRPVPEFLQYGRNSTQAEFLP